MNTLSRWDPFKELDELHNRLTSLFGRAPVRHQAGKEESITVAEWVPLVDVIEDENEYLIKA
ncbi:MAG: Hsp20/alpha crystallin family protein, partial [Verrucomicrobiae bacterium]|nr:Hsp20/alpha crystallin family protein [Verrucomicrobiae bacterium]